MAKKMRAITHPCGLRSTRNWRFREGLHSVRSRGVIRPCLSPNTAAANRIDGTHTHRNSFLRIEIPLTVKNRRIDIGDTRIGVHGRKYLVVSKGEKKATPSPPLVMESRSPWLAVARNKYIHNNHLVIPGTVFLNPISRTTAASSAANTMEWVNPRCPQKSPYWIPKRNPMTSRSGTAEQIAPTTHTRLGIVER